MDKKLVLIVIISHLIVLALGYQLGRYNVLNPNIINYNGQIAYDELTQNGGMPKIQETKQIPFIFVDSIGNYTRENVTVNIVDTKKVRGYAISNQIYVTDDKDSILMGHELCHVVLNRYGIVDFYVNEQICYTIEQNYDWRAGT